MSEGSEYELTSDELREIVGREARRRHGISGEDFIRLVQTGDVYDECGESDDLVALVRLLPEGDFVLAGGGDAA